MTPDDQSLSVLVGPTCPSCGSQDLRWSASLGRLEHGQCRDCGTEYHWHGWAATSTYRPTLAAAADEPTCPACGLPHDEEEADAPYCEDCELSDCVYCGIAVHRWLLSENLACRICETGEVA